MLSTCLTALVEDQLVFEGFSHCCATKSNVFKVKMYVVDVKVAMLNLQVSLN